MKRYYIIGILVSFIFITYSFSQSSNTGNWFYYLGNQALNKKWNIHTEVQYRNYNFAGDLEQLLLRGGVGYNLSEHNNNFLLGYAFVKTDKYINEIEKSSVNENRLWQQFITRQSFNRFFIQHRYRLEERWVGDSDMTLRFRYLLGLNVPLNKRTMSKDAIYVSAYNELFMMTKNHGFDRNRIYGGIGYCLNKTLRFELGYMSQRLDSSHRNQTIITFFNNLKLYKEE